MVTKVTKFVGATLILASVCTPGASRATDQTSTSKTIAIEAPTARDLPVTASSYPFLDSGHNLVPLNLAAHGYTETESLVSGQADVFDWGPDGQPMIIARGAPYATRILVRRPADMAKFSGNVVVEIMYDARSYDWAMMWGYLQESLMRNGDVWIGVTTPKSGAVLRKFDAQRYASINFAPSALPTCKTDEGGDAVEEGVRFEMLAQIGALLKSASPGNPLKGWAAPRLFLTEQTTDANTYASVFQTRLRLTNGQPIYDGFLLKGPGGLAKLSHCGQALSNSDPRSTPRNIGVPVIETFTPGEVVGALASRREDSDEQGDRFRRYEIAAANHLDRYAYRGFPSLEDQKRAGVLQGTADWPFNVRCTPEIQLSESHLLQYVFDGALQSLALWARGGPAPPKAPRIALGPDDKSVLLDTKGIAVGGVRTVFSDAPTFADALGSGGPGNCREIGGTFPYSWQYLTSLYGTPNGYASKALPLVGAMERQRWVTPADAEALREAIKAPGKPPTVPTK